jgi:hypothetical protein
VGVKIVRACVRGVHNVWVLGCLCEKERSGYLCISLFSKWSAVVNEWYVIKNVFLKSMSEKRDIN